MAMVVAERSPLEAASLARGPSTLLPRVRTLSTLGRLAATSAVGYALLLVGEAAVGTTPLQQSADTVRLALGACALILTLAVCAAALLRRRNDGALFLP